MDHVQSFAPSCTRTITTVPAHHRPVFGRLPEPNRAWLLVVYLSSQASQLSVYQSRDYHVYMPNTYQTRPVSSRKMPLMIQSLQTGCSVCMVFLMASQRPVPALCRRRCQQLIVTTWTCCGANLRQKSSCKIGTMRWTISIASEKFSTLMCVS